MALCKCVNQDNCKPRCHCRSNGCNPCCSLKTYVKNNYVPKDLDYENAIVRDMATGVTYIFDNDGVFTAFKPTGIVTSVNEKIGDVVLTAEDVGAIPVEELENLVRDADYVHTDNNFTDEDKAKLDSLGTPKTLTIKQGSDTFTYDTTEDVEIEVGDPDLSDYYTKEETDALLDDKADAFEAGDGVKLENGVLSVDKDELLALLGYTEIEFAKTDVNGTTVTVTVLGKVN